ncbi:TPA: D-tyrosyl-tRNA(Tyr) deacylase [candidate division WOR-3 bacterium]|jgi:D-tyrosyl-tRNA(Tyr) deacylase|uniref:D-aminoacyl-tRNA deacylase n=1 Tax=candidate division WOR-3 bacterium TaxID=2052148 RepID=A0A350H9P9_UNCW3|nr:D-tyrosyl-tRNA(Tyr) deacylase [candidate division WOR-3 bacterium]
MKLLVQRVSRASVRVNGELISEIGRGLCVFAGFCKGDSYEIIERGAKKLLNLRVFEDEEQKMNKSIKDIGGEILLVSQFTLCAELSGGNRPGFDDTLDREKASELYEELINSLSKSVTAKKGLFGALMDIQIVNHGPATFILETK